MRLIFHIASSELRSLFYSPVAWLVLAVSCVQTSMAFVNRLVRAAEYGLPDITQYLFASDPESIFPVLKANLMFYVPFLTMGVLAREIHSGSIKLLLSSPIGIKQIVVGKYLAIIGYFLLPLAIPVGIMLFSGAVVENFQYGLVLSGTLGIYLLICAYAAVGLFMSSLTGHQVVAATGTLAILAFLNFVGTVGQRIPLVDSVAYWLSISGRGELMMSGLIASKDVFYFFAIVILFGGLTCLRLSGGRKAETRIVRASRASGLIAAVVAFGTVTSAPALTAYLDATDNKSMTLSAGSREVMASIDGPWRVTVYVNALDESAYRHLPRHRKQTHRSLFDQYIRANPNVEVDYVWYYAPTENPELYAKNPGRNERELARRFAYQNRLDFDDFLSPAEVNKIWDFETEGYRNTILVSHRGRTAPLRTFADRTYFPTEGELSTALKRLTAESHRIAFVAGQGERRAHQRGGSNLARRISDLSSRMSAINLGFDIIEIGLDVPVPDEVDTIVLAGPLQPYSEVALHHFDEYIARGGDGIILVEPQTGLTVNPLLARFGLTMRHGVIEQPKPNYPADLAFVRLIDDGLSTLGFESRFSTRGLPMALPGAGALVPAAASEFEIAPVLEYASADTRLVTAGDASVSGAAPAFAAQREVEGVVQRWMIVADVDFMSSSVEQSEELSEFENTSITFLYSTLFWLSDGAYPIDTSRPTPIDNTLNLQIKQVDYIRVVLLLAIPALILSGGAGFLLTRARQ